jgi:hemolysin III
MIVFLVISVGRGNLVELVSVMIFAGSLIVTYGISTIYHASKTQLARRKLRILDHASIYILIAGTYTPFTLITLQGAVGWTIFGVSWSMALAGIVLKLFFTGRYKVLSTLLYIFMGWLIVIAIRPLLENLSLPGVLWLLAGGLFYTLGGVLYSISRMPFNHAAFHILTLLGSICHFVTVYFYVL